MPTATLGDHLGSRAQLSSKQFQLLYIWIWTDHPWSLQGSRTLSIFLSNLYHLLVKVHLWDIPHQHKFCFIGNNGPWSTTAPTCHQRSEWQQRTSAAICSVLTKSLSGEQAKARGLPSRRTGRGAEHVPKQSRATRSARSRSLQQSFKLHFWCHSTVTHTLPYSTRK